MNSHQHGYKTRSIVSVSHLDALLPALNEAREHLGKEALAVTADAASLPDWQAMIDVLLTTQHDWRKPRGINATLGFPPKSEHKRQVGSILEVLADDIVIANTDRNQAFAYRRSGGPWDLIVLISACCRCCKRTFSSSFSAPAPSITRISHSPQFRHWAMTKCPRRWRRGWTIKLSIFWLTSFKIHPPRRPNC